MRTEYEQEKHMKAGELKIGDIFTNVEDNDSPLYMMTDAPVEKFGNIAVYNLSQEKLDEMTKDTPVLRHKAAIHLEPADGTPERSLAVSNNLVAVISAPLEATIDTLVEQRRLHKGTILYAYTFTNSKTLDIHQVLEEPAHGTIQTISLMDGHTHTLKYRPGDATKWYVAGQPRITYRNLD